MSFHSGPCRFCDERWDDLFPAAAQPGAPSPDGDPQRPLIGSSAAHGAKGVMPTLVERLWSLGGDPASSHQATHRKLDMSSDLVFGVAGSVVAVLLTVLVGTVYHRRSHHCGGAEQPHSHTNQRPGQKDGLKLPSGLS